MTLQVQNLDFMGSATNDTDYINRIISVFVLLGFIIIGKL